MSTLRRRPSCLDTQILPHGLVHRLRAEVEAANQKPKVTETMHVAFFLSWAWCPKCHDWLIHKRQQKLTSLRCPVCKEDRQCEVWHTVPFSPRALALVIPKDKNDKIVIPPEQ